MRFSGDSRGPKLPFANAWLGIAIALAVQGAPVSARPSLSFSSPAGYALRYPAGWTLAQAASGRLLILSGGKRVQGPVIGPGQAAILVRTLGDREAVPSAATRLAIHTTAPGACGSWRVLDARDSFDPGPVEISRSLYCVEGWRRVLVQLTHWAGDPRQISYRRAATDIAASVRFVPVIGRQRSAPKH